MMDTFLVHLPIYNSRLVKLMVGSFKFIPKSGNLRSKDTIMLLVEYYVFSLANFQFGFVVFQFFSFYLLKIMI